MHVYLPCSIPLFSWKRRSKATQKIQNWIETFWDIKIDKDKLQGSVIYIQFCLDSDHWPFWPCCSVGPLRVHRKSLFAQAAVLAIKTQPYSILVPWVLYTMLCHVMAFLGNIWPLKKKEGFTLLRIFVTIKEVWPLMKKLCILAQNVAKNSTTIL